MMEKFNLYTVGHSTLSQEELLALLWPQNINCVIDVRSVPYSKYTPQFNSENIKSFLNRYGIYYAHFGEEFGARRTDCLVSTEFIRKGVSYTKNQVNFEKGVETEQFQRGVSRLKKALSQGRTVALMCSEANPLSCHRFSFISRYFYDLEWNVKHIIRECNTNESIVIPHKELEEKMIMDYVNSKKLTNIYALQPSLFDMFEEEDSYSEEDQRRDAYRLKNKEIGWIPDSEGIDDDY